jgi:ADP-ribose pyrophosphatase YjhB (NUDIX family)
MDSPPGVAHVPHPDGSSGNPDPVIDRCWRAGLFVAYRLARVWWFLRRPVVRSAYVAVWWDDRLLLIRNSYKRGETVPCGGVHRGESIRSAARRELEEEVGIGVAEEKLAPAFQSVVQHECTEDHCHFFELILEAKPELRIDRREVIWADFLPRAELAGRPLIPQIRNYLSSRDH